MTASTPASAPIPVIEEDVRVEREVVQTGAVRVRIRTDRQTTVVDEPLRHHGVEIERVPVHRVVEERREPWQDGPVTVVPVYQEILVRQTVLVEELRLTPTVAVTHQAGTVELRSETAVIERQAPDGSWVEIADPDPATSPVPGPAA